MKTTTAGTATKTSTTWPSLEAAGRRLEMGDMVGEGDDQKIVVAVCGGTDREVHERLMPVCAEIEFRRDLPIGKVEHKFFGCTYTLISPGDCDRFVVDVVEQRARSRRYNRATLREYAAYLVDATAKDVLDQERLGGILKTIADCKAELLALDEAEASGR